MLGNFHRPWIAYFNSLQYFCSSRIRHTRYIGDWSSDVCSSDLSFDVVLSTFGAMFAPDQERTAREMLRVCRPGGKIGLATWPPDSLIGEMFRTVARFVPPPAGARPPALWGTEDRLRELFGGRAASLRAVRRPIVRR